MVKNKVMIDELKKFNKDLEKHLPNLNLDFLSSESILKNSDNNDEYTALIANNLMDVKTEIALLRRNIVSEVEGMVLRVINDEQSRLTSRLNSIYNRMVMDLKDNFTSYIGEMSGEVSRLKSEVLQLKDLNVNILSEFDEMNDKGNFEKYTNNVINEVSDLKKEFLKFQDGNKNILSGFNKLNDKSVSFVDKIPLDLKDDLFQLGKQNNEILSKFESIDNKGEIESFSNKVSQDISKLSKDILKSENSNKVSSDILNLEKKMSSFKNQNNEILSKLESIDNKGGIESFSNKVSQDISKLSKDILKFENSNKVSSDVSNLQKEISYLKKQNKEILFEFKNMNNSIFKLMSNSENMLSLEKQDEQSIKDGFVDISSRLNLINKEKKAVPVSGADVLVVKKMNLIHSNSEISLSNDTSNLKGISLGSDFDTNSNVKKILLVEDRIRKLESLR